MMMTHVATLGVPVLAFHPEAAPAVFRSCDLCLAQSAPKRGTKKPQPVSPPKPQQTTPVPAEEVKPSRHKSKPKTPPKAYDTTALKALHNAYIGTYEVKTCIESQDVSSKDSSWYAQLYRAARAKKIKCLGIAPLHKRRGKYLVATAVPDAPRFQVTPGDGLLGGGGEQPQ